MKSNYCAKQDITKARTAGSSLKMRDPYRRDHQSFDTGNGKRKRMRFESNINLLEHDLMVAHGSLNGNELDELTGESLILVIQWHASRWSLRSLFRSLIRILWWWKQLEGESFKSASESWMRVELIGWGVNQRVSMTRAWYFLSRILNPPQIP